MISSLLGTDYGTWFFGTVLAVCGTLIVIQGRILAVEEKRRRGQEKLAEKE